jgi:hypothetical protein
MIDRLQHQGRRYLNYGKLTPMYILKLESNPKEGVASMLRPDWYWHHTTDEFRTMWAVKSARVGDKNNVDVGGKMEDNSDHSSDVEVIEISSFSIRGRSAASALDKVMKETKEEEIMITFKEESIAIPGELIQPTATSSVPVVEVDKALTGQIEDDRTEEEVVNDNIGTMQWFTSASSIHAFPTASPLISCIPHLSFEENRPKTIREEIELHRSASVATTASNSTSISAATSATTVNSVDSSTARPRRQLARRGAPSIRSFSKALIGLGTRGGHLRSGSERDKPTNVTDVGK